MKDGRSIGTATFGMIFGEAVPEFASFLRKDIVEYYLNSIVVIVFAVTVAETSTGRKSGSCRRWRQWKREGHRNKEQEYVLLGQTPTLVGRNDVDKFCWLNFWTLW
jgi:hypothetical protein